MIALEYADMVGQPIIQPSRRNAMIRYYEKYADNPFIATAEATAKGYAISQIDGPLPIMDGFGMAYAIFDAGSAWYEYIKS